MGRQRGLGRELGYGEAFEGEDRARGGEREDRFKLGWGRRGGEGFGCWRERLGEARSWVKLGAVRESGGG